MRIRISLGPDIAHPELHEVGGRKDGILQIGADGHDYSLYLIDAELAEGLGVGRIGGHRLGEVRGVFAHVFLLGIDSEDLHSVLHQLASQGRTEPAHANDDDRRDIDGRLFTPQGAEHVSQ